MRYDKILIDLDDTLLDFHTANRRAIAALTEELNLASDTVFDEYQTINHACWAALERGEMDQETLHVERFRRFLASKNRADDPARTADRFAELLGRQSVEIPGAYEMLRAIAARRPVVFLSNGITAIQRARLSRSRLTEFAAKVVISQEAGVSKPDPRIFEIALDGTVRGPFPRGNPTHRAAMSAGGKGEGRNAAALRMSADRRHSRKPAAL